MVKTPKYTDAARFRRPYVSAKDSQEPGYLRDRFEQIRAEQKKDAAEVAEKVRAMKGRK